MGRPRRIFIGLLKASAWSLAGLLVILAGVVTILHTGWGRERVREILVAQARAAVDGDVVIESIGGFLLSRPVLRGVSLRDRSGRPVVEADAVEIEYNLLSLLRRTFRADKINVLRPRLRLSVLPAGDLNIARLFATSKEPAGSASEWTVMLQGIEIRDGSVILKTGGREYHVSDVEMDADVRADADGADLRVGRLSARWADGESRLHAGDLELRRDGSLEAAFAAEVPAGDIRRLLPDTGWKADLNLTGTISRQGEQDPLHLGIEGRLAQASFKAQWQVRPETPTAGGTIEFQGLDPGALDRRIPSGKLAGKLEADLDFGDPAGPKAGARGSLTGSLGGAVLDKLDFDAAIQGGSLRGTVSAAVLHGNLHATFSLLVDRDPVVVESARITGSTRDLGAWLAGAAGSLEVEASIQGPVHDLTSRGSVRAEGLRIGDLGMRSARAGFSASGLLRDPRGRAEVDARGISHQGRILGSIHSVVKSDDRGRVFEVSFRTPASGEPYALEGDLTVRRLERRVSVDLRRLRLITKSLAWDATAKEIAWDPTGRLSIGGLKVSSAAGSIYVDGYLRETPAGWRPGDLRLQVGRLDLEKVLGALPEGLGPSLHGRLDLEARATGTKGGLNLSADGKYEDLILKPGAPGLSGSLRIRLDPHRITADVTTGAPALGRLELSGEARAPPDALNVAAWKRIGLASVSRLRAGLVDIDLGRVLNLAGLPPVLGGKASGSVVSDGSFRSVDVDLSVRDLKTDLIEDRVQAKVKASLHAGRLILDASAGTDRLGSLQIEARVRAPGDPLDPDGWHRAAVGGLESLQAGWRDVDLGRLAEIFPALPLREGKASADIQIREGSDPVVDLSLREVRLAGLSTPVGAGVTATIGRERIEARAEASLGAEHLGEAQFTLDAGRDSLEAGRPADLLAARTAGTAEIRNLPLRLLAEILDLGTPLEGTLEARISLAGTLLKPVIRAQAEISSGRIGNVGLDKLTADVRLDEESLSLQASGRQPGEGYLDLDLNVDRKESEPIDLHLTATRFRLGPLAGLARLGALADLDGIFDAELRVRGTRDATRAEGWLELRDGRLRLSRALRPLHGISLKARLRDRWLSVDATARSDEGTVSIGADAVMDGLLPREATATVSTQRFPVMAGGMLLHADANLEFAARREGALWKMSADIRDGTIRLPAEKGFELHDTGPLEDVVWTGAPAAGPGPGDPAAQEDAPAPALRLHLVSPGTVTVRDQDVDARLRVDMDVTLVDGQTSATGIVEVASGHAVVFGRRYEIKNARASFRGVMPPDPEIDLNLVHDFGTVKVTISVSGTARRPEIDLRSDPPGYDRTQLLAIVLGRDPGEPGGDSRTLEDRALGVASGLLLSRVQSTVRSKLPIDTLRVDTEPGPDQTTRLTVGKWITEDIFVAYRHRLGSRENENANEANIEYRLGHNWILEGSYGDSGKGGVDILWVKRF